MTEATASVKPRRKVPMIWLVPIVAALLGVYMVVHTYMNEGPEISIIFNTAEGIEAGKTKIKSLNISLGVVESVEMTADLEQVLVKAKMEHFASPLLREDTQFWVVRPRVGPGGISGLGTILAGGYIQLEAGTGKTGKREFEGLEEPPVTPAGSPGLQLILESERAASVGIGVPVLFRGYKVGAVESEDFDPDSQRVRYRVFIDEPFDALVSSNTRFWNSSGIRLKAGADGFDAEVGSLETILVGGVAFDLPEGAQAGDPAKNGDLYDLLPNRDAINRKTYENHVDYVVAFEQSVRGLEAGAPVEFRGIKVGSVQRLMVPELASQARAYGSPIPVLIRIEPGRMGLPDTPASAEEVRDTVKGAVAYGLRATLKTANLLTGSVLVAVDYYRNEPDAALGEFAGYAVVPTVSTGIGRLENQVSQLLKKFNDLDVETTLQRLDATFVSLREAVDTIRAELTGEKAGEIKASTDAALKKLNVTLNKLNAALDSIGPDSPTADRLNQALVDFNQTLRNVETLTRKLSDKPNSLIFSTPEGEDPMPKQRGSR